MISNLSMAQGDTLVEQVTFTDQSGNPVNDLGALYCLTAKYQLSDADGAAIFAVTANQSSAGVAFLTVSPANTLSIQAPSILFYDIRVEETSGRVTTVQSGTFTVLPAVLVSP